MLILQPFSNGGEEMKKILIALILGCIIATSGCIGGGAIMKPRPVEVTLDHQYEVGTPYGGLERLNYVTYVDVEVTNKDTEPGTFIFNCKFKTLGRGIRTDEVRLYVVPGETETGKCKADTKFNEEVIFSYDFIPATKTVYR